MNFENVARSYEGEGKLAFLDLRICGDQYVGRLGDLSKHVGFVEEVRKEAGSRDKKKRCIILVLESPHKDEFTKRSLPGPAVGSTGRNITKYLSGIPEFKKLPAETGVILMNAIQHQCSLGEALTRHRDDVFDVLWRDGGYQDFQRRFKELVHYSDVIVNCCTKGSGRWELVDKAIDTALCEKGLELSRLGLAHPGRWPFNLKLRYPVQKEDH